MPESLIITILGVIQGLTEFLPISSSAHLALLPKLFGWEDPGLAVDAFLHLGSLMALFIYFARDIWQIISSHSKRKLLLAIALATLPVVILGFTFRSFFTNTEYLRSTDFIAITLIAGAILMFIADRYIASQKVLKPVEELNFFSIFCIGVAQSMALFPGISRSGVTIATGLFVGLSRQEAARFAFLIGIPAVLGAGLLSSKDLFFSDSGVDIVSLGINHWHLLFGFMSSFISGYIAIDFLIKFLEKSSLFSFVLYRILLALFLLFIH